jgi:ATP-dependent DNA helicase Rep
MVISALLYPRAKAQTLRPLIPVISFHMSLNPPQHEAAHYLDGPMLVLAGAGSGKTKVITEKIAWLIRSGHLEAKHIAAITFTNKAAREMRERLSLTLGSEPEGLTISTFHALGLKFLQFEHQAAGLKRNFSVLADDESRAVMKDLAVKGVKTETLNLFQSLISRSKNALLSPDEAAVVARSPRELECAKLFGDYQRRLDLLAALDFDDLIARPVRLLRDNAEVRARWQGKIRYLLVDEYQDTNAAQYQLLTLLAGERGMLTAVGDDDQSIYSWRGANPENMNLLAKDYPQLKVVKLEQNYRCSKRILHAANVLIARNPHVFEKKLWSENPDGDPIALKEFATDVQEAEFIAASISNLQALERTRLGEIAVLYRGNHLSRAVELALRGLGISYQLSGGTSLFERQEIRDLLAHMRLLANPDDDVAFMRAIRAPKREIGDTSIERLAEAAQQARSSMLHAASSHAVLKTLTGRAASALTQFAELQTQLRRYAEYATPGEVATQLIARSGYLEWLKLQNRDAAVFERRREILSDFTTWLSTYAPAHIAKGRGIDALNAALTQISLAGKDDDHENAVRLMTLHSAKGLEFDHVYLIGMDDGTFPHQSAIEEGRLEEERRLLYVGITRARKQLTLSYPKTRNRYGAIDPCDPSRFLRELPEIDLPPPEAAAERSKKLAQGHLAAMRAMLSG